MLKVNKYTEVVGNIIFEDQRVVNLQAQVGIPGISHHIFDHELYMKYKDEISQEIQEFTDLIAELTDTDEISNPLTEVDPVTELLKGVE